MSLAIVYSRGPVGILAPSVSVEVHIARGMPRVNMVGLPTVAVKESKDRVRSAILNTLFEFPRRRVTINLAPADLPKEGGRFDLPIAMGILAASGQLPKETLADYEFVGELALSGELRPVSGILPVVLAARETKRTLIVPKSNEKEAGLLQSPAVLVAGHLLEVCAHLKGEKCLSPCAAQEVSSSVIEERDLNEVCGQAHAKRALEIAASGKHSLLFRGPPGTGKTMLAGRLTSILPEVTEPEALEIAAIASVGRLGFDPSRWRQVPFRAPHHSCSAAALVGGGRPPRPGEISLAHHGVLFLDELPEFDRSALESLREPLERGQVTISRAAYQATFPAQFQLVAAMNPCPCGFHGERTAECRCTQEQIERYKARLSGPLLDRIDMQVDVPRLSASLFANHERGESSQVVKARVQKARERQLTRQGKINQNLSVKELEQFCKVAPEAQTLLDQMMGRFHFSARTYHRAMKVGRTIADLAEEESIQLSHMSEALLYRI